MLSVVLKQVSGAVMSATTSAMSSMGIAPIVDQKDAPTNDQKTALTNEQKEIQEASDLLEKLKTHVSTFGSLNALGPMEHGWFHKDAKLTFSGCSEWSLTRAEMHLANQKWEWLSGGIYENTRSWPAVGPRLYTAWKVGDNVLIWIKEHSETTFGIIATTKGQQFDLDYVLRRFHFTDLYDKARIQEKQAAFARRVADSVDLDKSRHCDCCICRKILCNL